MARLSGDRRVASTAANFSFSCHSDLLIFRPLGSNRFVTREFHVSQPSIPTNSREAHPNMSTAGKLNRSQPVVKEHTAGSSFDQWKSIEHTIIMSGFHFATFQSRLKDLLCRRHANQVRVCRPHCNFFLTFSLFEFWLRDRQTPTPGWVGVRWGQGVGFVKLCFKEFCVDATNLFFPTTAFVLFCWFSVISFCGLPVNHFVLGSHFWQDMLLWAEMRHAYKFLEFLRIHSALVSCQSNRQVYSRNVVESARAIYLCNVQPRVIDRSVFAENLWKQCIIE